MGSEINMELEGKVAIVTGASSGIGLAISEALAKEKATVVMAARRKELLDKNAKGFSEKYGAIVDTVATDMTDQESVRNLLKYTIQQHGIPSILVNSAGIFLYKPLAETTSEEYDLVFNLNCRTKINFIREALQDMKKGTIVNISSGAGLKAYANQSAYCSSMASLNSATQVLDLELQPNIRAYAIAPGLVDTEMARKKFTPIFGTTEKEWEKALKPKDVAEEVVKILKNPEEYYEQNNKSVIVPIESGLKA